MRPALIVVVYFFAFIILDIASKQFEELPGVVAWYPAAGVTYTLLLVFGVRFTPAVTIALLLSSIFIYRMPQPFVDLFMWAFVMSSIYGLAAGFLRQRIRFDWHLQKLRDVTWFVFMAILVSALLAIISVLSSTLNSDVPQSEIFSAIFRWWIGETVGVLTVTPFLLIHVMPGLTRFMSGQPIRLPARWSFSRSTLSTIGQAFILVFTLYWVIGAPVQHLFQPMYLITLPLLWIALTRGFKGVTTSIVGLNFGVVLALWIFGLDLVRLGELQLLMIVNCIVGLLMGAVVTERKRAEDSMKESEEKSRLLITQMHQGLAVHEIILNEAGKAVDYRFLDVNESFERLIGQKRENIIGKTVLELLPDTESYWIEKYGQVALTGDPLQYENYSKEQNKYFEIVAYSPRHKQFAVIVSDITERKNIENLLRTSEEKYRLLTEFASDVIWVLNLTLGKFTYISPSVYHLRGFTAEEAINENLEDAMTPESLLDVRESIARNINVFIENPGAPNHFINEIQQPCKNGDIIWVEVSSQYRYNSAGEIEVVGVSRNIEERKKAEKDLLYLSNHDSLTGLYNRRHYDKEINRLNFEKCSPLTLVMADVNGLKLTNDAFGHQVGDMLLQKVAKILKRECRAEDIVARIGGDEFVLLLPETDLEHADKLINRINAAIANEKIDNVILSISIGSAERQEITDDIDEIYKKAEDEMYRHKLSESLSMRSKTLDVIMNTLYEKSNREMAHSKRVSQICEAIATRMNFNKDDVNQIRIAGLMHDIGKIGIDEKILNKAEKLNNDEWNEMKRHPEIGYRILTSVNEFSEIAKDVLEHHERWNGGGYPRGLKGEEISLQARIICVADAFDAMTGERTYSMPLSEADAIQEIRRCSGTQFAPDIVGIFIEKVLGEQKG